MEPVKAGPGQSGHAPSSVDDLDRPPLAVVRPALGRAHGARRGDELTARGVVESRDRAEWIGHREQATEEVVGELPRSPVPIHETGQVPVRVVAHSAGRPDGVAELRELATRVVNEPPLGPHWIGDDRGQPAVIAGDGGGRARGVGDADHLAQGVAFVLHRPSERIGAREEPAAGVALVLARRLQRVGLGDLVAR